MLELIVGAVFAIAMNFKTLALNAVAPPVLPVPARFVTSPGKPVLPSHARSVKTALSKVSFGTNRTRSLAINKRAEFSDTSPKEFQESPLSREYCHVPDVVAPRETTATPNR